jgi:hypothetical protein
MAIRINLLAEEQAAEEMRRKNPVKLAIWIGSFLVAVVLLWILKLQLEIGVSKKPTMHHRAVVERQYGQKVRRRDQQHRPKRPRMERKLAALDRLATNRFFWAPVLNALQQTMIDGIQVIRITGVQKYTKEDAKVIGTGPTPREFRGPWSKRVSLYIDAKDFNPNAQNYNKFKETCATMIFLSRISAARMDSSWTAR